MLRKWSVLGRTRGPGFMAGLILALMAAPGHGAGLPDNRGFEVVSPPERPGGDVLPLWARTRAAADGGAIAFTSLTGFADVRGMGIATEYMAVRSGEAAPGTHGWSTHAITPPQQTMSLGASLVPGEPGYQGAFSDDLSTAVFQAWSPLTDDPMVAEATNNYVRRDLLTPGIGAYELVTACPLCVAPLPVNARLSRPTVAGTSEDFQHVIFESRLNLAPGATGTNPKLFEWDSGTVRLVSVLPTGAAAARGIAGHGVAIGVVARTTAHPISRDGSRIVFTVPPNNNIAVGPVYVRINGRTTVQLNASERTVPGSAQPAEYWDASADGSRVFFTTIEALTDNAPVSADGKLYMWERQATNETQSVRVSATTGTFTLRMGTSTSAPIAFNATAGAVQTALEALPPIGSGNVTVTGGPGDASGTSPYEISFVGNLAGVNMAQLTSNAAGLAGGTAAVATRTPLSNLTYLNVDREPVDAQNNAQGVMGVSDDGRSVYFLASGQLVPGKPAPVGVSAYHWQDGVIRYIGELPRFLADRSGLLDGTAQNLTPKQTQVTSDGRFFLFATSTGTGLLSAHGGVDYAHGACGGITECKQLYVYSSDDGTLRCASCNPSGGPGTANAEARRLTPSVGGAQMTNYLSRPLTEDGRYAFFSTTQALVPEDVNARLDAYEYNVEEGTVHLLSSGRDLGDSYFLDASKSGNDVFIATREQLVGWDRNQGYDLYDVRVGGGFPEPAAQPTPCVGEACQGGLGTAPSGRAAGSATTRSAGDESGELRPRPRGRRGRARACRRGRVRRRVRGRVRCVRARSAKRAVRGARQAASVRRTK